jgi:hypothetical protein
VANSQKRKWGEHFSSWSTRRVSRGLLGLSPAKTCLPNGSAFKWIQSEPRLDPTKHLKPAMPNKALSVRYRQHRESETQKCGGPGHYVFLYFSFLYCLSYFLLSFSFPSLLFLFLLFFVFLLFFIYFLII